MSAATAMPTNTPSLFKRWFTPKYVTYLLMGLFLSLSLAAFVFANNQKPRILVLQSYDLDYTWSRDINSAIDRALLGKRYLIRKHYMDTKRQTDREFAEKAGIIARRIIDEWRPTILIAVDDDAQRYAAKFYTNRDDMKVVFAGINGEIKPYGYDTANNATGILERKQFGAVRDVMIEAARGRQGRLLRFANIGDQSGSVKEDTLHMEEFDWKPASMVSSTLVRTFDEWQDAVRKANKEADFIVTTNYRRLEYSKTDRRPVPPKEVVEWTENNSTIPVIGTNGFYVEDGGGFAIGTSPFEQGEVAAEIAISIIEKGKKTTDIKVESTREFIVYMRPTRMKPHDFDLGKIYESFARAMNNYYE